MTPRQRQISELYAEGAISRAEAQTRYDLPAFDALCVSGDALIASMRNQVDITKEISNASTDMSRFQRMTEREFNDLKKFTGTPAEKVFQISKLAEITGRSQATLSIIRNADTFADYSRMRKAYFKPKKTQKPVEKVEKSFDDLFHITGASVPRAGGGGGSDDGWNKIEDFSPDIRIADALERIATALEERNA